MEAESAIVCGWYCFGGGFRGEIMSAGGRV